ncbi:glycosyltransferase family 2 protein [Alphaproteobacteria bacterium]|jgi:glycosyltransferase involved in cell wall biosynthesis|nr:glycosyltransferase family 2 protein [Alphaproteobacteria bacterium]
MQEKICAIILTKNEDIHLNRVLKQISKLTDHILIVDSGSVDETITIAEKYNCEIVIKEWKNYATQFNFAIEHVKSKYDWILRIDADEYFEDFYIIAKIIDIIRLGEYAKINGVSLNRKIEFLGHSINYGGIFPIQVIRLFRSNHGLCENRWMDEHIIVDGKIIHEKVMIIDDNKRGFEFWLNKHIGYAKREAVDMLFIEYGFTSENKTLNNSLEAGKKRALKENYYSKLPLFIRPILYFIYRYFVRLGFVDGRMGFLYHFFHALWYRLVVDLFIYRVKLISHKNGGNIRTAIREVLHIDA